MFEELGLEIREEVVFTLFHAEIAPAEAAELDQAQRAQNGNLSYAHETAAGADAIAAAGVSSTRRCRGAGHGRIDLDRDTAHGRRLAAGEGRPQRSVLVRLRQEVQEVPWRIA